MKYIYQHNTDGYTVGGINGIPLEDLLSMCRDRLSFETESYAMRLLRSHISTLEGLDYLGVDVTGKITYNYVSEDGRTDEVTVTAKDFLPMDEYIDYISANCGYDPSSDGKIHIGLKNVKERLEMMCGGTLEFSPQGGGTLVTVSVPGKDMIGVRS